MTGMRPDEWSIDQIQELSDKAAKIATHIAAAMKQMRDTGIDSISLQARERRNALDQLLFWAEFDLRKAVRRQAEAREKGVELRNQAKRKRPK